MNDRRGSAGKSGPRSNLGTFLALAGLLFVGAGLLTLVAFVNIAIFGVLVVIGGFGLMALFHYLVWGWWLSSALREQEDAKLRRDDR